MSTERHKTIVDVLLILVRDQRILLAERQGTGYADGMYNLPSGHLEASESVLDGMIRESREELGITLEPLQLRCVHVMHHRNPEGQGRIGIFFQASAWSGEPENREPHKCARLSWFEPQRLPENTVPYTAAGVQAYLAKNPFSVHGW